ncbi:MAG: hypothetical protein EON58_19840 [Alphaproteobacteria bacterium]|nr:MAG: hypothetical protein EON58_19840 [Alphaproteobacteria bacterium]
MRRYASSGAVDPGADTSCGSPSVRSLHARMPAVSDDRYAHGSDMLFILWHVGNTRQEQGLARILFG